MDPKQFRRMMDDEAVNSIERARAESPPEKAAIRHGVWLQPGVVMRCEKCLCMQHCPEAGQGECPIEVAYIPERQQRICQAITEDGGDPDLLAPLIVSAVWAEVRLARAMRALAVLGEMQPEAAAHGIAVYQPVADQVPKLQDALERRLDALNLTPAARAKLEADRQQSAGTRVVGMVIAQQSTEQERRQKAIEAEFEAEDDDSDRRDAENAENPPSPPAGAMGDPP